MECDILTLETAGEEMAWISVYESINGAKLRNLHKTIGCSKFEATGILNFLWFWGLENARPDGFLPYTDREDIERYLFGEGAGCKFQMTEIVDALISTGWIDEEEDGLHLHDWSIWQDQWYKYKERQKRNTEAKRTARADKKVQDEDDAAGAEESPAAPSEEPEKPNEPVAETKSPKYTENFETFWTEYPRKDDKGAAYKQWQARMKDGFSPEELVRAAKNYAYVCKKKHTQKEYIKQGKTFLGVTLVFRDFLPEKKQTEPAPGGNPFAAYGEDA